MYSYGTTSDRLGTGCSTSSGCPVKHIMFLLLAPAGSRGGMVILYILFLSQPVWQSYFFLHQPGHQSQHYNPYFLLLNLLYISFNYWIAFPAAYPVDQAICRLKPPVNASRSSTSPAKYNPFTSFDSIVPGSISFTLTPPFVIIASG